MPWQQGPRPCFHLRSHTQLWVFLLGSVECACAGQPGRRGRVLHARQDLACMGHGWLAGGGNNNAEDTYEVAAKMRDTIERTRACVLSGRRATGSKRWLGHVLRPKQRVAISSGVKLGLAFHARSMAAPAGGRRSAGPRALQLLQSSPLFCSSYELKPSVSA